MLRRRDLLLFPVTFALGAQDSAHAGLPEAAWRSGDRLHFRSPHPLGRAQALARMEQLVAYWSGRYAVRCHWVDGTAHLAGRVMTVRVDARLLVGETEVTGDASDPGLFFRSAAMGYVRRKLRKYLHPTYEEG